MATYSIEAAEADLDGLVDEAAAGEDVLVEAPGDRLLAIIGPTDGEVARLQSEPGA